MGLLTRSTPWGRRWERRTRVHRGWQEVKHRGWSCSTSAWDNRRRFSRGWRSSYRGDPREDSPSTLSRFFELGSLSTSSTRKFPKLFLSFSHSPLMLCWFPWLMEGLGTEGIILSPYLSVVQFPGNSTYPTFFLIWNDNSSIWLANYDHMYSLTERDQFAVMVLPW